MISNEAAFASRPPVPSPPASLTQPAAERKRAQADAEESQPKRIKEEAPVSEMYEKMCQSMQQQMQQQIQEHRDKVFAELERDMALEKQRFQQEIERQRREMKNEEVEHKKALDKYRNSVIEECTREKETLRATLARERDEHENSLCTILEQLSAAQAELEGLSVRPQPAPVPAPRSLAAPAPDKEDVKQKLRQKLEAATRANETPTPTHTKPSPSVTPSPVSAHAQAPLANAAAAASKPAVNPGPELSIQMIDDRGVARTQVPNPSEAIVPRHLESLAVVNSSTHPKEWGALYRITKASDCHEEVVKQWNAGLSMC